MLVQGDSFLKRIITGDKTLIHAFHAETAQHSSELRLKDEAGLRQRLSKNRVMLTVLFDCHGVIYYEFLPTGQTLTKNIRVAQMRVALQ